MTVHPEVLVAASIASYMSLIYMVAVGEGLNVLEANMKRPLQVRAWRAAG